MKEIERERERERERESTFTPAPVCSYVSGKNQLEMKIVIELIISVKRW